MTPIALFESWLAEVENAQTFNLAVGHWTTFEASISKKYIAYRIAGGQAIREVETRVINVSVTLVSSKVGGVSEIEPLAEAILKKTLDIPSQCDIVAVNMLGEITGPHETDNQRKVLTMTLQMII